MVAHSSLQIPDIPVHDYYMGVCRNVRIYLQASLEWLYTPLRGVFYGAVQTLSLPAEH